MKTLAGFIGMGLMLVIQPRTAWADLEIPAAISIHAQADFYAPLAPSGEWISVGSYGRCWRPNGVAAGWRPYCEGHWVWTDCGWYWESDEPWAWACYHYGSWLLDPAAGWIWIPGIEWAPAWVSWRAGAGFVGWAPLPPRGMQVAWATPQFVFVETSRFQDPMRPAAVIASNERILNQTTVINNMRTETRNVGGNRMQKVVVNEGPGASVVEKATGKQIKPVQISQVAKSAPSQPKIGANSVQPKSASLPAQKSSSTPQQNTPSYETKPPATKPSNPAPEQKPGSTSPGQKMPTQEKKQGTALPSSSTPAQKPGSTPDQKIPSSEKKTPPSPSTAPTQEKRPSNQGAARKPDRSAEPSRTPEKGTKPEESKGKGKDHEKENP